MQSDFLEKRKAELQEVFKKEPAARVFQMVLTSLGKELAVARMPINIEAYAAVNIAQGGVIAVIADYACVYLAMMQCEDFTPLASLSMEYLRPAVFVKDKEIVACAKLVHVGKTRIVIDVSIRDEKNILKAVGKCVFARSFKPNH